MIHLSYILYGKIVSDGRKGALQMTAEYIYRCTEMIGKIYKTKDPEAIFSAGGTTVEIEAAPKLRGRIFWSGKKLCVCASGEKGSEERKIELARLLGHAVLHREKLLNGEIYKDMIYPDRESADDREASLFAADLLINDAEIRELECFGMTDGQIASSLGGRKELMPLKKFSLRCRGVGVAGAPIKSDVGLFVACDF